MPKLSIKNEKTTNKYEQCEKTVGHGPNLTRYVRSVH